jgi:hypothetical protein
VLVKGFLGARVMTVAALDVIAVAWRGGGPVAVLSQVGAVVVLAVVFALADREEPGVLLDTQSCCSNLTTWSGSCLRARGRGDGLAASAAGGHRA